MTRLVVKHHRPMHTWLVRVGGSIAVLLGLWLAFVYGEYRAGFDRQAAGALQDALDAAQERGNALNDQIAVLQQERTVDQSARQEVQTSLEDLQHKLADAQEEVTFYKGIISPGSGEEGLRVQSLKFSNGGAPRLYHYRLVLIQARTREFKVSGSVTLKLYGVQGGKPVTLDARDVAPNGKAPSDFSFQYFQSLEGDAFLPADFTPGRVEVSIQESGHEPVQQTFDWTGLAPSASTAAP